MRFSLRGSHTFWRSWRKTPDAPRIVLGVSFEIKINHQSHFSWQAVYLVYLANESCCSAHCTGRFMCRGLTVCSAE